MMSIHNLDQNPESWCLTITISLTVSPTMIKERRILDQQAAELRKLEKELSHANEEARTIACASVCHALGGATL